MEGGALAALDLLPSEAVRLYRQHGHDFHIAWIDDYDVGLIDEIEIPAPCRLKPHQRLWHRHDVDALARYHCADGNVEIDMVDARRSALVNYSRADLIALLIVELHINA